MEVISFTLLPYPCRMARFVLRIRTPCASRRACLGMGSV